MKIDHKAKSLAKALKVNAKKLELKCKALAVTIQIERVTPSEVAHLIAKEFSKREILYLATDRMIKSTRKISPPFGKGKVILDLIKIIVEAEKEEIKKESEEIKEEV
jgi:hypothetical protein